MPLNRLPQRHIPLIQTEAESAGMLSADAPQQLFPPKTSAAGLFGVQEFSLLF